VTDSTDSVSVHPSQTPPRATRRAGRGGALRQSAFRRLWLAESTSLIGTQVTLLAIPSLAILVGGASAAEASLLYALTYLPAIVVSLPIGLVVDRLDRRRLMIAADLARVVVLATVPMVWATSGQVLMPHLYLVAILMGLAATVYELASQSSLSAIVDEATLGDANAKLATSQSLAQLIGAPVAGALVQALGAALAVVIDAVSYVVSALLITSLPAWGQGRPSRPDEPRSGQLAFLGGIQTLLHDPYLRRIVAIMAMLNLGGSMVGALFLVFAYRALGLAPATVGVVLAIGSLGALTAAAVVTRVQAVLGVAGAVRLAAFAASASLWLIPAATLGSAPIVLVVYESAFSFSATIFWVSQVTLRQGRTPPDVQGRTHAAVRVIALGTLPLGAFLGGVVATRLDVTSSVILGCAVASFGCTALLIRWPRSPQ
jgi:predicted MFS family arabinose efflux permease